MASILEKSKNGMFESYIACIIDTKKCSEEIVSFCKSE